MAPPPRYTTPPAPCTGLASLQGTIGVRESLDLGAALGINVAVGSGGINIGVSGSKYLYFKATKSVTVHLGGGSACELVQSGLNASGSAVVTVTSVAAASGATLEALAAELGLTGAVSVDVHGKAGLQGICNGVPCIIWLDQTALHCLSDAAGLGSQALAIASALA